jgi:hypothetical protein
MAVNPAPANDPKTASARDPATHEQIALLAYQYWEARGRPIGSPDEDWFRAEQDVLMERLVWGQQPASPRPKREG